MNHRLFQVFTRPPSKKTESQTLYQVNKEEALPVLFVCLFLILYCFLTHFEKPAFPVRVKEGQREVVPVVLRDFEGLAADARVQFLELCQSDVGENPSNKNQLQHKKN